MTAGPGQALKAREITMTARHHVDRKIKNRPLKPGELALLGQEIAASAAATVVLFIDLTDSTLMKYQKPAEEWIGLVYEFIKRCDIVAQDCGGFVVKHIGDEVMVTFPHVPSAECFISTILSDSTLIRYRYKAAADFGEAYFMHSHRHRRWARSCPWPAPHDPYGRVVDRCARIVALAPPGAILCSEEYKDAVSAGAEFPLAGTRLLKGVVDPCRIYFRHVPECPTVSSGPCLVEPLERVSGFSLPNGNPVQTD
jgi:class 3 adenylate cyclase